MCTKHQNSQIYEANIDRNKGRNRQQHNNSRRINTPLSIIDREMRQKINKETEDLNNTIDHLD